MKVLVLGDGNFSFSLALANHLKTASSVPHKLLCWDISPPLSVSLPSVISTSFDSLEQLTIKYLDTKDILPAIKAHQNFSVLHNINAWELDSHFVDQKFDVIIWNHPHLGTEDFRLHRFLLAHFFHSVTQVLAQTSPSNIPIVCVSLVEGQENRWQLIDQAKRAKLDLLRVTPWLESEWPGYEAKRNKNGKSFKNFHTKIHVGHVMKSQLFQFTWKELCSSTETSIEPLIDPIQSLNINENPQKEKKFRRDKIPVNSTYACPDCGRMLSSERGLRNHIHTVHELKLFGDNWSSKVLECPDCPRTFSNKYDLWQHQVNKHTGITRNEIQDFSDSREEQKEDVSAYDYVPCGICGQAVLNTPHGELLHLETLKPVIGQDMACPKCNSKFIEQRALLQHYKFCRVKQVGVIPRDIHKDITDTVVVVPER